MARNYHLIQAMTAARGVKLMVVTKAACSFPPLVAWLVELGATCVGDSQPASLAQPGLPAVTKALLKAPPSVFEEKESWDYAFVSHRRVGRGPGGLVVVLEMGDGKDGIPPGDAVAFVRELRRSAGRPLLGVACNFSCLMGRQPDEESWAVFAQAAAAVRPLLDGPGLFSAGGTVVLEDLEAGRCRAVNQVRVGEGLLLGADSARAGALPGFSTTTAVLWGEVLEVADKDLSGVPLRGHDAFGRPAGPPPAGRHLRAVLDVGSLAAGSAGLTPLESGVRILGQTFDFLVVELSGEARQRAPGDRIGFRPDYGALSQASLNPFVHKVLT